MAMTSASSTRKASSSSLITGTPRAWSATSEGISSGTPGLTTTSSAPRKASSGWPDHVLIWGDSSPRATGDQASRGAASEASTWPPSRATSRAAATPLLARPTTATVFPSSQRRYAAPLSMVAISVPSMAAPHLSFSVVSARSASMNETIQKRTMILGSAQPCSS